MILQTLLNFAPVLSEHVRLCYVSYDVTLGPILFEFIVRKTSKVTVKLAKCRNNLNQLSFSCCMRCMFSSIFFHAFFLPSAISMLIIVHNVNNERVRKVQHMRDVVTSYSRLFQSCMHGSINCIGNTQ